MSDKEIALQLTLKLLETGHYVAGRDVSNDAYGRAAAELYNTILNSIHRD